MGRAIGIGVASAPFISAALLGLHRAGRALLNHARRSST